MSYDFQVIMHIITFAGIPEGESLDGSICPGRRHELRGLSRRIANDVSREMAGDGTAEKPSFWHPRMTGVAVRFSGMVTDGKLPDTSMGWAYLNNAQADPDQQRISRNIATGVQRVVRRGGEGVQDSKAP